MKKYEIRFTDYVDGTSCTRLLEADEVTAKGLELYREQYAGDLNRVIRPEDENSLLAAFCTTHDTITDHIIERCGQDFDYCHKLTKMACEALSAQGMDWMTLGESKFSAFQAANEQGKLDEVRKDFNAFVQFMIRANRPVPTLFQDLESFREV